MPTITIPVEDWVFILCVVVGGGLLLITVVLDDVLGGVFDFLNINFDVGGVSLMPLLLSFISMFGVGGLFATKVLGVHEGAAAVVGAGFGGAGVAVTFVLFRFLHGSEGPKPFSLGDLVGRDAFVAVGIPAGRFGSVLVKAEGQTHEYSATSQLEIPQGATVRITGTAGAGLIVNPVDQPSPAGLAAGPQHEGETRSA
jgi:membrane protein implicated in regulation of membrane protease activity